MGAPYRLSAPVSPNSIVKNASIEGPMAALLSVTSPASSPLLRRLAASPFKGNASGLRPIRASPFPSPLFPRSRPLVLCRAAPPAAAAAAGPTRFRLDNLGPQPGSRRRGKRKGRGIAAGQGNSCGFGMRGQKSRSGPGVRKGFEGGQMPLYRRIPKLRGIAGGMHAGLPKCVHVNLKDIENAGFQEGDEISLESLKEKGLINPSGRERRLPLKVPTAMEMKDIRARQGRRWPPALTKMDVTFYSASAPERSPGCCLPARGPVQTHASSRTHRSYPRVVPGEGGAAA